MNSARILGGIGRVLIGAGVVVLLFVAYQLWGTGIQEARAQSSLSNDFDELLAVGEVTDEPSTIDVPDTVPAITPPSVTQPPDGTPTTEAPGPTGTPQFDPQLLDLLYREGGEAAARIEIPDIGVNKVVVEGVQVADLRRGPGHYGSTPMPGQEGNSAIAGHRTTYGAPFNRIDELEPGDTIRVTTVQGEFEYQVIPAAQAYPDRGLLFDDAVRGHTIVAPSDTWVLDDYGDNRLTLTACHPKFSARQRIIVTAVLVEPPVETPDRPIELVDEVIPGEDIDGDPQSPDSDLAFGDEATLDEGLDGDSGALLPAIIWGLLAQAAFGLALLGSRQWRRWPSWAIGAVPVVVCLWFCFEKVDRLLPAY